MNIEKMLTCKYCNKVYNEPITLTCCGESLCKQHIQDLLSIDDTNSLICPFCNKLNSNQNANNNNNKRRSNLHKNEKIIVNVFY